MHSTICNKCQYDAKQYVKWLTSSWIGSDTNSPVGPVEQPPIFCVRMWPENSHYRLNRYRHAAMNSNKIILTDDTSTIKDHDGDINQKHESHAHMNTNERICTQTWMCVYIVSTCPQVDTIITIVMFEVWIVFRNWKLRDRWLLKHCKWNVLITTICHCILLFVILLYVLIYFSSTMIQTELQYFLYL